MPTAPGSEPSRTALLAGATGLVGGACLRLGSAVFDHLIVAARRPLPGDQQTRTIVVSELEQLAGVPPVPARAGLCALGTTMAKAGSKEAFRRVDHDAVLAFARWVRAGGAATFVTVSSAGASPGARNFYLQVKGQTEQDLQRIGFPRLVILRPGVLLGPRRERRLGEALAQMVLPRLNPLLRGPLRPFRAIRAEAVAAAMLAAAARDQPGVFILNNDEIEAAARSALQSHPPAILSEPQKSGA
jgi:uncharacterized protein YbjT (DUF2867 family)